MQKKEWWKIFLVVGLVIIDLVSKALLDNKSITVISGVLRFESSHNIGAGFSLLEGKTTLFIIGAILFCIGMILFNSFSKQEPQGKWYFFGFTFMIAGTLGNMIDRIVFGYVRDFIFLEFISFPVFNVADICLTIGTICFSVYILFFYDKKEKKL